MTTDHHRTKTSSRTSLTAAAGNEARSQAFLDLLARRVAHRTESMGGGNGTAALAYLSEEIVPELDALGFDSTIYDNPESSEHPLLIARREENADAPTVLLYGHGDVQFAHADLWADGLNPWALTPDGDRLYGRGSADNKGQHTVNTLALKTVLATTDELGYNVTILMETGEEAGSIGLRRFAMDHTQELAADLFLASDGPRIAAEVPTLFLGSRGALNFRLVAHDRDGDHHSGNWGGRLRNPATVIAAAVHALVDGKGVIRIPALRPPQPPASVRAAVAKLPEIDEAGAPVTDPDWGEPGLTPAERVFAFNVIEVLALEAGDPQQVNNAIPGRAAAHMQLRFVVGTEWSDFETTVHSYLEEQGFTGIEVVMEHCMPATRLDPDSRVATAAAASILETTGVEAAIEPNLGGTIPNDVFAEILGLPTVWVPHSYPGCNQHAPDEHALHSVLIQGAEIMAGMFWDMSRSPDEWFTSTSVGG